MGFVASALGGNPGIVRGPYLTPMTPHTNTQFVGRTAEMAVLTARFELAAAGNGGVALIAGEPGIGKTRLAHAVADQAESRGALVLWGRCYEGDWSPPFAPWVEAIGGFVRSVPPERIRDSLGLSAPQGASSLAQIVPDLGPLVADLPGLVALGPDEERLRLYDAVVRFLLRLAEQQPLVVVLDDLHWADRATLDLLRHVVYFAAHAPLLLLATYRDLELGPDHPLTALLPVLRREAGTAPIALKGLDADEVAQFLGVAGDGWNATLARTIYGETNGNPFFIEELLRHLVEEVKIVSGREGWTAPAGIEGFGIPEGVRQVVTRRLARLSTDAERLLTHAAVFTGGFEFPVLQALTDLPEDALLDAIDEALGARLIQPVLGGQERYDFVHAIVRHALTETWSPSRRVRLHRRAAEALARASTGRERERAAELAVQYHRSLSLPGAEAGLPFALAAADEAKRRNARDQVVTFLRMSRDLAAGAEAVTRANILTRLAIAEAEAVQIEDSQQTTTDALAALEEAGTEPGGIAEFLASVVRALKHRAYADPRVWRPLVERGLALAGNRHDRAWALLKFLVDPIEPISRETIRAGRWLGYDPEAVAIARASGDEDAYARSYESWDPRTRAETDELVSRARGWQRPSAIMYALTVAANGYQYVYGAFRDAEALWQELSELSERTGAISWQQQAISQLTGLHLAFGRFEEARETDAVATALGARLGPGLAHDLYTMLLATYIAIYLGGDWPQIADYLTRAADDPALGPHDPATLGGAFLGAIAAYAHAEAGSAEQARRLLDALTPIAEQMDLRTANQNDNGTVAHATGAVWRLGVTEYAAAYRRLALELLAAGIGDDPLGSTELSVARMAALLGNAGEASEYFARARHGLAASGRRPLRAIVDLDEAVFLLGTGPSQLPRVAELLDAATAAFGALGMMPWLARAETARADADALAGRAPLPGGLTEREVDVLRLVARGHSDRDISDALFISPRTVNAHMRNMLNKTGSANRTELSIWAFEHGLVSRDEQGRAVAPR
jgi:DNA-binding CsgD family transcriptional regulator